VTFVKGRVGRCFKLTGRGAYINIGNVPSLRIAGDQTVAMWVRPDTIEKHMNPFHKAYGGEFSVLLRLGGRLRYAFGMAGSNGRPYASLLAGDAVEMLKARKWVHFAAVRDLKAKRVRLYINGRKARKISGWMYRPGEAKAKPYDGDITPLPKAVASSYPAYIGRGNNECFAGLIDEVAIWARPLYDAEIAFVAGVGPGVPDLDRVPGIDRLLVTNGDVLLGSILNAQFTVTTSFGKVTVLAGRVVGFTGGVGPASGPAAEGARRRLVLTDGQVLVGKLTGPAVQVKVAAGSTLRVPADKVRGFAYRISGDKPDAPRPTGTMVSLASGERLALAGSGPKLQLLTAHGKVLLPAPGLRFVDATGEAETPHRACFVNGSVLSGTLLPEKLVLKLRLGAETAVTRDTIQRIDRPLKPLKPTGAGIVELRNGDRLFGTILDKVLTLQTSGGKVTIRPRSLRAMAFDAAGGGDVEASAWGGTVVRGRLVEPAVTLAIDPGGPTVKVKAAEIAAIARPSADPPEEITRKVVALISQLGAESYRDREAATKALQEMGPSIIPLLRRHLANPDPEVQQRIQGILEHHKPTAPAVRTPRGGRPPSASATAGWTESCEWPLLTAARTA
jgi:hypothetical protein